jgi:hypothetical protein
MTSSTPDYYSLIARAVSGLSHDNSEAREELYDRARKALTDQLRATGAADEEIMREQRTLATAIHSIEHTFDANSPLYKFFSTCDTCVTEEQVRAQTDIRMARARKRIMVKYRLRERSCKMLQMI